MVIPHYCLLSRLQQPYSVHLFNLIDNWTMFSRTRGHKSGVKIVECPEMAQIRVDSSEFIEIR